MSNQNNNSFREQLLSQEKTDSKLQKTFHAEAKKMYTEKLKKGQRFTFVLAGFLISIITLFFWAMAKVFEQLQIENQLSYAEPIRLVSMWAMYFSALLIILLLWPAIRGKIGLRFYPKIVRLVFWVLVLVIVTLVFSIFEFIDRQTEFSISNQVAWALTLMTLVIVMGVYLLLSGRIDRGDLKNKAKTLDLEYRLTELEEKLKRFVEAGGVLMLAIEQMSDTLWELAGITNAGTTGQCRWYKREWDYYPFHDEHAMEYRRVKPAGADVLFFSDDEFYSKQIKWPVATMNRVGQGRVIVGTPKWLMANATTMQNLFSELLGMIVDELVPVRVYGDDVQVMFNRNRTGWVVTLINNAGSDNSGGKPNALRQDLAAGVILEPRFSYSRVVEWVTGSQLEDLSLILPPGEVRIVEIIE